MKIGIDIRNIGRQRTGDEAVFFNLVKNLALIDFENEYILFTDITEKENISNIQKRLEIDGKNNFRIVSLESHNKFIWNFWTLPKYIRKNPIDIYHTQYITPFFVPRKIKILTMIHDISFNFFPQFIRPLDLFFLKILIPRSIKRADKIVGVSEFTRNEIIKYYKIKPGKVEYVHNAVGDEFRKNLSRETIDKIQKKYKLPDKFVMYIGTFQPRKNIPFLIEAFASLKKKIPDVKLVLAGNKGAHNSDREIDKIIREKDLQDQVIFTGFVEEKEKVAIFRSASVFAFPSLYEGFGIPILEAFFSETPVVLSDIKVFREVAGEAAYFADPKSVDEFSEKLYNIFIDEYARKRLVNSGKERLEFFSWKKTAEKMLEIYRGM